MGAVEEEFRRFVARARALSRAAEPPTSVFRTFVAQATPLATAHVRGAIHRLAEVGPPVFPWLIEHDVLEVAGYAWVETAYTNLLAWALYPPGREEVALACQVQWARRVAPSITVRRPVKPWHQFHTDDGIPDLVFDYDGDVIIVEAKTKTFEHATPSGKPQTVGYVDSVAERLGIDARRCHVVYVTPTRMAAANPNARAVSYAETAVILASALVEIGDDDQLIPPYATLITHFMRASLPGGLDAGALLERICRWSRTPSDVDGSEILRDLESIQLLASLLLPTEGT